jgi:opacity protein-like surface antigen
MKTFLVAAATLIVFAIPSICAAADGRPGFYFSGFLGSSFARDTTVNGYDAGNNPYSDKVSFDPGIYAGGTGGYDFGFLRLEGELSYRHANIDTINAVGYRLRSVDGNVGAFATMFNVFFDMHNTSRVTPYIGGGIGFATLHISDTWAYDTLSSSDVLMYEADDDTVFAAQAGGGLDVALNNRLSLDLGYRYFITDKAKFDAHRITSGFRLESHNAMVGFKVKF